MFDEGAVRTAIEEVLERVGEASGIDLTDRELYLKPLNEGRALEGRVYYRGPTGSSKAAKIKLDISGTEAVVRPTVLMSIRHGFPDELPAPGTVRAYSFEELFAEKIRAMGERGRPRDLYDIVNLYRHRGLGKAPEVIHAVLVEKCDSKSIAVPTATTVLDEVARAELESEWDNMLGHQLPSLPSMEFYLSELDNLFLWLEGSLELEELPAAAVRERLDAGWTPPSLISTWGGAPIESVRFAAANLLLVKMGYKGGERIVEPYSLRRTRAGDLLLYAQRPEEPHIKAYRVDRIERIEVQREVFEPRYPVEFSPDGAITARPTRRRPGSRRGLGSWGVPSDEYPYEVECALCGKVFKRKKPSTKVNPHKDPDGFPCQGRHGFLV